MLTGLIKLESVLLKGRRNDLCSCPHWGYVIEGQMRLRATFTPEANLDQRFSHTQAIRLQRAEVVSQDQRQATVAVDLVESDQQACAPLRG